MQPVRASLPHEMHYSENREAGKDEPEIFASDGTQIKMRTYLYEIDMALCCYCGLCTFSCPTHCLIMTPAYEYSVYELKDHIYHFAKEKPLTVHLPMEPPPAKA